MAKNVVIIGGGASGLMAAIWASRLGAAVTVLEKNDKPGRKLLATGNGRCNFTNRYQDASCYRTGNQERASRVLEQFTEQDTEQFFEQLGIRIRSREGWLYPASEQAQSVLDHAGFGSQIPKGKNQDTGNGMLQWKKPKMVIWCAPKDGSTRLTASSSAAEAVLPRSPVPTEIHFDLPISFSSLRFRFPRPSARSAAKETSFPHGRCSGAREDYASG